MELGGRSLVTDHPHNLGIGDCIKNYGDILSPLEKMTGEKGLKLSWTEDQEAAFRASQKAIADLQGVYIPRPDDQLITYSDYSEEHNAIGGRLEIIRVEDGVAKKLHGGFFSAILSTARSKWCRKQIKSRLI